MSQLNLKSFITARFFDEQGRLLNDFLRFINSQPKTEDEAMVSDFLLSRSGVNLYNELLNNIAVEVEYIEVTRGFRPEQMPQMIESHVINAIPYVLDNMNLNLPSHVGNQIYQGAKDYILKIRDITDDLARRQVQSNNWHNRGGNAYGSRYDNGDRWGNSSPYTRTAARRAPDTAYGRSGNAFTHNAVNINRSAEIRRQPEPVNNGYNDYFQDRPITPAVKSEVGEMNILSKLRPNANQPAAQRTNGSQWFNSTVVKEPTGISTNLVEDIHDDEFFPTQPVEQPVTRSTQPQPESVRTTSVTTNDKSISQDDIELIPTWELDDDIRAQATFRNDVEANWLWRAVSDEDTQYPTHLFPVSSHYVAFDEPEDKEYGKVYYRYNGNVYKASIFTTSSKYPVRYLIDPRYREIIYDIDGETGYPFETVKTMNRGEQMEYQKHILPVDRKPAYVPQTVDINAVENFKEQLEKVVVKEGLKMDNDAAIQTIGSQDKVKTIQTRAYSKGVNEIYLTNVVNTEEVITWQIEEAKEAVGDTVEKLADDGNEGSRVVLIQDLLNALDDLDDKAPKHVVNDLFVNFYNHWLAKVTHGRIMVTDPHNDHDELMASDLMTKREKETFKTILETKLGNWVDEDLYKYFNNQEDGEEFDPNTFYIPTAQTVLYMPHDKFGEVKLDVGDKWVDVTELNDTFKEVIESLYDTLANQKDAKDYVQIVTREGHLYDVVKCHADKPNGLSAKVLLKRRF